MNQLGGVLPIHKGGTGYNWPNQHWVDIVTQYGWREPMTSAEFVNHLIHDVPPGEYLTVYYHANRITDVPWGVAYFHVMKIDENCRQITAYHPFDDNAYMKALIIGRQFQGWVMQQDHAGQVYTNAAANLTPGGGINTYYMVRCMPAPGAVELEWDYTGEYILWDRFRIGDIGIVKRLWDTGPIKLPRTGTYSVFIDIWWLMNTSNWRFDCLRYGAILPGGTTISWEHTRAKLITIQRIA